MQTQPFPDTMTWLEFHGFKAHPFEHLTADADHELSNYFESFPFLREIEKPTRCSFLFMRRGTGKSANRIILTEQCEKSLKTSEQKLAVPYTDFSRLIKKDKVTLADHVEEILREAVPRLYDLCIQRGIEKLPEEFAKDFVWFIRRYSDKLDPRSITMQLDKIENLSDEQKKNAFAKIMEIFKGQVQKPLENLIPGASVLFDLASVFMNIKTDQEKLSQIEHSPLDLMSRFAEISKKFNIKYIYILIDRVDEYAKIFDYEKAAEILKPLTETIPLLEMPPYAFKFFLPIKLRDKLSAHLRSDRFDMYDYEWQPDELKKMFQKRLSAHCDKTKIGDEAARSDFKRLFSDKKDFVSEMIRFADKSPRNLLKLAKIIFDEHTRSNQIDELISKDTYERGLSVFAKEQIEWESHEKPSVKELGELDLDKHRFLEHLLERDFNINDISAHQTVEKWQKNDRFAAPHFSLTDVIRSLNIPKSEAREKARQWEDAELVTAHYKIEDESLARFLFAKKGTK